MVAIPQKIMIFQQNNSGKGKIEGITRFGNNLLDIEILDIDQAFPPVIDDTAPFLPEDIRADLVLDFLRHPDLSHDLSLICLKKGIPVVASGKKSRIKGVLTPPT
jgi:hypothetical protein